MFQIAAQYGDPQSCDAVQPIQLNANGSLARVMTRRYFRTLKKVAIVLRVSGEIWHFAGEGPEKLRFSKVRREISADLVVPQEKWQNASRDAIHEYLAGQLRSCLGLIMERMRKEDELLDANALTEDFESALSHLDETRM